MNVAIYVLSMIGAAATMAASFWIPCAVFSAVALCLALRAEGRWVAEKARTAAPGRLRTDP